MTMSDLDGSVVRVPRVAVIIDGPEIKRWQSKALATLLPDFELRYYCIRHNRPQRRSLRHALYYALNLATIRRISTQKVPVSQDISSFEISDEGAWADLPDDFLKEVRGTGAVAIIKFGLGLLRVPPPETLPIPILSYHHGNPQKFRGRPAGFYEMLGNESFAGQIVQALNNQLDAGSVLAFAETKIFAHSYRKTLANMYAASPFLLRPALERALAGKKLSHAVTGKNHRLPGNAVVTLFAVKLVVAYLARIYYGLFFEKAWNVSLADDVSEADAVPLDLERNKPAWKTLDVPNGFTFLADPFFSAGGDGILVEAMRASTGTGCLMRVSHKSEVLSGLEGGHCSFPTSQIVEGQEVLLAETSQWSDLQLFKLDGNVAQPIEICANDLPRLVDPVMLHKDGTWYLFGNAKTDEARVLRLWRADRAAGPFAEHPSSPIAYGDRGARMAGMIAERSGVLIRYGQDFVRGYGDGIAAFRIDSLTRENYAETHLAELRFTNVLGPHTLNYRGSTALFDWYVERFSPLAGWRRIKARLNA